MLPITGGALMKPLIWIIDEEWPDYEIENSIFKQAFEDYEIRYSKNDFKSDLDSFGSRADAVLCQVNIAVDAPFIEKLDNCKVISVYGSGYNNVDTAAAANKGIPVAFVPGYCAVDIAEYVLAAMLYFNKGFSRWKSAVATGLWGAQAITAAPTRLAGQKLLIVGLGRIGREVAKKAIAAGLTVLAFDPYQDESALRALGVQKVEMDDGLAEADFISIHAIFNSETTALLSMKDFQKMKKTAVLINASRGGVIDQNDLIKALNGDVIAGAALDVLKTEPPIQNDPILSCKNLLLTPHISYLSGESLAELQRRAAQSVADVLKNIPCSDLVPGTSKG
jgi:phosphoglycerate dehydrogenase-like enzyme